MSDGPCDQNHHVKYFALFQLIDCDCHAANVLDLVLVNTIIQKIHSIENAILNTFFSLNLIQML